MLAAVALLNSFIADSFIRHSVTANLTMGFICQLPVPRLTFADPNFTPIVQAAGLRVTFGTLDGQDVCRVKVPAGGQKRHAFYLRMGNKAEELASVPELSRYIRGRWRGGGGLEHGLHGGTVRAYRSNIRPSRPSVPPAC